MRLRHDPRLIRHVTEAKKFGRVAVMFGGTSSEREISLLSGNACLQALLRRGVDAHPFDPRDKPLAELVTRNFDRVFIALHGPGGEDGTLQGALEFLGMPYTGSGVMGSAIGMDKLRTKRLAQAVGIPTTDYMVLRSPADLDTCLERLGLPLIVKPATQGSSVGMTKVEKAEDLPAAYQAAALLEPGVFAEPWITGAEYTVAVLQGRALPSIRIETPAAFYDGPVVAAAYAIRQLIDFFDVAATQDGVVGHDGVFQRGNNINHGLLPFFQSALFEAAIAQDFP